MKATNKDSKSRAWLIWPTHQHHLSVYYLGGWLLQHLSNYSLAIKRSGVTYWSKNLNNQRINGEAISDLSLQFLHPKELRSSLSPTLLLQSPIYPQFSKTSMVNLSRLVDGVCPLIQNRHTVRIQSKYYTCYPFPSK